MSDSVESFYGQNTKAPHLLKRKILFGIKKGFGGSTERKDKKANENSSGYNDELDFSTLRSSTDIKDYCKNFNMNYPGLRKIYNDPLIFEIDNFFDPNICDDYIARAQSKGLQISSQTFSPLTTAKRTSTTWYLPYKNVPEFLYKAEMLTGYPINHYEEPQIVRYEMGQQFSWHYDSLPKSLIRESGQRVATLLVYLNTVTGSGATAFKDLKIKVAPKKGSALLFFPCFADGTPDERTMHAGQIAFDTKWIAQM